MKEAEAGAPAASRELTGAGMERVLRVKDHLGQALDLAGFDPIIVLGTMAEGLIYVGSNAARVPECPEDTKETARKLLRAGTELGAFVLNMDKWYHGEEK